MRDSKWIWLDMDGTFVDFYGVQGWLEYLMKNDTTPYEIAEPIYNVLDLLEVLVELKTKGYNIGIVSWSSKARDIDFDRLVEEAKRKWLFNRCFDLVIDKFIVTQYGVCKADTCRKYGNGVLVDDEEQNRKAWDLGATIDANKNIIKELWKLVKQGLTKQPLLVTINTYQKKVRTKKLSNSNSGSNGVRGGGIGFCGLLTIVFIVLKLLGKISWSWVWVLSPLWISWIVILVVFLIVVIVMAIINR